MRAALAKESGGDPSRPSGLDQLSEPRLSRSTRTSRRRSSAAGIPAVTITTARARPPEAASGGVERLHIRHLSDRPRDAGRGRRDGARRLARAGAVELPLPRAAADPRLGDRDRARRDAAAVHRRGGRPLRPLPPAADPRSRRPCAAIGAGSPSGPGSARSSSSSRRLGFWGSGDGRPPSARTTSAGRWRAARARPPRGPSAGSSLAARLLPRRAIRPEERLAGSHRRTARAGRRRPARRRDESVRARLPSPVPPRLALAAAGAGAARRPFARSSSSLGFAGPAYLVWTFATHYGLGWDAPWYIAQLFAVGYAPRPLFVIGARLARGRRTARRARGGPLRAVSRSGRAPAARPDPRSDPHARPRAATPARPIAARHRAFRRSQETIEPAVSSPFPRGTWTSASAALALAIMCDS